MQKFLVYSLSLFIIMSCSHRSGKYVLKNGSWVFESSQVGFQYHLQKMRSFSDYEGIGKFLWPLPSSKRISSKFGPRKRSFHDGIDIKARRGSHILAAEDGKVLFSGWMKGYGRIIIIDHKNKYHTVYAHNSKHFVKKGDTVSRGEVIGLVGSTGRSSGPHLHFEVRKENVNQNPIAYFPSLKNQIAKK